MKSVRLQSRKCQLQTNQVTEVFLWEKEILPDLTDALIEIGL